MSFRNGVWFEDCFECGGYHPKRDKLECKRFERAQSFVRSVGRHFGTELKPRAVHELTCAILSGVATDKERSVGAKLKAARKEAEAMRDLLEDAKVQIEYMRCKFKDTTSGGDVIARISAILRGDQVRHD